MRVIISFLFLLALSAAPAMAADDGVYFKDDFANNRHGWNEVYGLKDLKAVIEDGRFAVRNNLMQTYLSREGVLMGLKNFEIQATFSGYKSDARGEYGLKFGTPDQKNSYTFAVNGRGEFQLSAVLDGNKQPVGPWEKSPHIRPAGNKLSLKCSNGTLDMLVNDHLVDGADCANAAWDRAGFIVGGKVSVDVDDFMVRRAGAGAYRPDGDQVKKKPAKKAVKKKRVTAITKETIFQELQDDLRKSADKKACDETTAATRRTLKLARRLSDADLKAELDYTEKHRIVPPGAAPGADCAVTGYKSALQGAIEDRHGGGKKAKKAGKAAAKPAAVPAETKPAEKPAGGTGAKTAPKTK